ncbi:MAG: transposase [Kiritimatiellae bacterium]|nr:transposase [Kiritimatiellia bacterium]
MDELPKRKRLPHDIPSWVSDDAVFFITVCCRDRGVNQLCRGDVASAIFESVQFRQERGDWFVHLCLLMPDHVHALVSFPRDRAMKKVVRLWKENTAKRTGVRWQKEFFDHRLRNDENHVEKAAYIRMNPVRAGLVKRPEDWPWRWEGSIW